MHLSSLKIIVSELKVVCIRVTMYETMYDSTLIPVTTNRAKVRRLVYLAYQFNSFIIAKQISGFF